MCGRVIQSSAPIRLAIVDGLDVRDSRFHNYPPRWNGAPSQELLVIRRNRQTGALSLDPLRWGLIPYSCSDPKGGRKPINGIGLLGQLAFDRLPLKEAIHRQYAAPPTVGRIDRHLLRPQPPTGRETNWVPTDPARKFELMARFYGPKKEFFDKVWKLPDVEKVN